MSGPEVWLRKHAERIVAGRPFDGEVVAANMVAAADEIDRLRVIEAAAVDVVAIWTADDIGTRDRWAAACDRLAAAVPEQGERPDA